VGAHAASKLTIVISATIVNTNLFFMRFLLF
jgi:hypothetical protein